MAQQGQQGDDESGRDAPVADRPPSATATPTPAPRGRAPSVGSTLGEAGAAALRLLLHRGSSATGRHRGSATTTSSATTRTEAEERGGYPSADIYMQLEERKGAAGVDQDQVPVSRSRASAARAQGGAPGTPPAASGKQAAKLVSENNAPEGRSEKPAARAPDRAPESAPDMVPEKVPGGVPERLPGRASENAPERVPEMVSEKTAVEETPDTTRLEEGPERLQERLPERLPEEAPIPAPRRHKPPSPLGQPLQLPAAGVGVVTAGGSAAQLQRRGLAAQREEAIQPAALEDGPIETADMGALETPGVGGLGAAAIHRGASR